MGVNYILITADGRKLTREDLIHSVRDSASKIHWTQCFATIHDVCDSSGVAEAIVTNGAVGTLSDDHSATKIETEGDSIDKWQIVDNKLIEMSSTELDSSLKVAGKILKVSHLADAAP